MQFKKNVSLLIAIIAVFMFLSLCLCFLVGILFLPAITSTLSGIASAGGGDNMSFKAGDIWLSADYKYAEYYNAEYFTGQPIEKHDRRAERKLIKKAIKASQVAVVRDDGDNTPKTYCALGVSYYDKYTHKRKFIVGCVIKISDLGKYKDNLNEFVAQLTLDHNPIDVETDKSEYGVSMEHWGIVNRHVERRKIIGEDPLIRSDYGKRIRYKTDNGQPVKEAY